MGRGGFEFDDSRWPIVVVRLFGSLSTEDYVDLLDQSELYYARQQPHVGVVDLQEMRTVADAAQRRFLARRTTELEMTYGDAVVCHIMVVRSQLMRGALTAVEWLRNRQKRDIWVNTLPDAWEEADRKCREHHLSSSVGRPPPPLAVQAR